MKTIGIVSEDFELINHFREIDYFDTVQSIDLEEIEFSKYDVVLLSDRIVPLNDLKGILDLSCLCKCFYMVSHENLTNMSQTILQAENAIMIPPRLTIKQVFKFVLDRVQNTLITQNKVFTFFGADAKVGTTMMAQCVSERLAKVSERVVFLPLHGRVGDEYLNLEFDHGLDDIKTKLQNKVLSHREITDLCIKSKAGYYFLPGLRNQLLRRHFHPEQIVYLIQQLESLFDTVIIDAGSNIDLGMSIAALNCSPNRFLVTTQQEIVKKRFLDLNTQILKKLSIDQFMLVINKYVDSPSLDRTQKIAKDYNATYVASLPYMEYGWQCEQDRVSLSSFNNGVFENGIEQIVKLIALHLELPWDNSRDKQQGIFHNLFGIKNFFKQDKHKVNQQSESRDRQYGAVI